MACNTKHELTLAPNFCTKDSVLDHVDEATVKPEMGPSTSLLSHAKHYGQLSHTDIGARYSAINAFEIELVKPVIQQLFPSQLSNALTPVIPIPQQDCHFRIAIQG
jgi:hypothetical protein